MSITTDILKGQLEQAMRVAGVTGQSNLIDRVTDNTIEKGGAGGTRAKIGEIRQYGGKDYRKEADGSWTKLGGKREGGVELVKDKEEDKSGMAKFEALGRKLWAADTTGNVDALVYAFKKESSKIKDVSPETSKLFRNKYGSDGADVNTSVKRFLISLKSPEVAGSKQEPVTKVPESVKPKSEPAKVPEVVNNSLESTKSDYNYIKKQLSEAGYSEKHRSFAELDSVYNEFKEKATKLVKAAGSKYDIRFTFGASWYDHGNKASIGGDVSIDRAQIYNEFIEDYRAQKAKYTYGFSADGFMAERLKEICGRYGVKVSGGEASYSTHGSGIYLPLASGELK